MIMKNIIPNIICTFFVLLLVTSCSRRDVIIEYFEVQTGDLLILPIEHTRFPYPQTNIYFEFDPALKEYKSRDFSDVVNIKAYNNKNEVEDVKQIYDVNGAGRSIQVSFENEKAKISKLELLFNVKCSGKVEIVSWQPL